jgi:hypothetical protein
MRVAIVGSRTYPIWHQVHSLVRSRLPEACTIVSGGAEGVDTWAANAARKRKGFPEPVIFLPKKPLPQGYFIRNQLIVDYADVLIAFWDGKSRGTVDTIKKAYLKWPDLLCIWVIEPMSYKWWADSVQLVLRQYARYGLPERRLLTHGTLRD